MNNHESDQDNNKNKKHQISIELDDSVIQLPLSTFINIIEYVVTNHVLEIQTDKTIIDLNDLVNNQYWKKNCENLKKTLHILDCYINHLERELKKNKFAQPKRGTSWVQQQVSLRMDNKMKMASNALWNSNKIDPIFTISDSEDDAAIITDTSKFKPIQPINENIIDLIDLDDNTKNLADKYKPALKSKTNVSIPDLKTNDNNTVLPINTEAGKTLSNGECLSTTIQKRKPGSKSKTMFASEMVLFSAENKKTVKKKMRFNEFEVINNKELNIKNMSTYNSVNKLKVPEKYNHNVFYKSSNLKYPPPLPLTVPHRNQPSWNNLPPIPNMTIETSGNKVTLTWNMHLTWKTANIKMYELFVCQETDAPPNISMWKKKGNIEADLLPMIIEVELIDLGHIYHFALRAVDVHNRRAPFAVQKTKI
ncbi:uncharacterized protein LOC132946596 [Metopolophium dirhodum]|uniref:uncharacterized protein LOC132946596 n=1 Tax=Metopolophium dirhodum TaxID=44670 RepID=UPI00298F4502|nr:uncharacterized protein LOC132946596 [Metopolophium dirhodum]